LTTAATLWFVTVVGLCFGSGQMGLGLVGSLLALAILRALKILERKLRRQRVSRLRLKWEIGAYDATSAMSAIRQAGLSVAGFVVKQDAVGRVEELRCSIRRLALPKEHCLPPSVAEAAGRQGVLEWEWTE
jgi:putative Mg2+ transporter-C (MgtC) family protein